MQDQKKSSRKFKQRLSFEQYPIIQITSVIFSLVLLFTVYDFYEFIPQWAIAFQATAVIIVIANWLLIKRIDNHQLSASIIIFCIYSVIMVNMQFAGGIETPHFAWILIIPLLAGALVNAKLQILFWALTYLGTVYYYLVPVELERLPYEGVSLYVFITRTLSLTIFSGVMLGYFYYLKQKVDALKIAKQKAQEASKMKSQFLANMSHELRTPLNAIIGFSETLNSVPSFMDDPKRREEYIGYITESGKHLLNVVNDVLDMAKIESGKMELRETEFCVGEQLRTVVATLEPLITKKSHTVSIDDVAGDVNLFADPRMVKQMIINLLSNAIKYTDQGGNITMGSALNSDGSLVVSVTDNGKGIEPDALENIMTPFYQAEDSYARSQDGTGLGLSLVNAMVQMHGGILDLQSEVGHGTTATLMFPKSRVVVDLFSQPALVSNSSL